VARPFATRVVQRDQLAVRVSHRFSSKPPALVRAHVKSSPAAISKSASESGGGASISPLVLEGDAAAPTEQQHNASRIPPSYRCGIVAS
jgi:hypothetical protein